MLLSNTSGSSAFLAQTNHLNSQPILPNTGNATLLAAPVVSGQDSDDLVLCTPIANHRSISIHSQPLPHPHPHIHHTHTHTHTPHIPSAPHLVPPLQHTGPSADWAVFQNQRLFSNSIYQQQPHNVFAASPALAAAASSAPSAFHIDFDTHLALAHSSAAATSATPVATLSIPHTHSHHYNQSIDFATEDHLHYSTDSTQQLHSHHSHTHSLQLPLHALQQHSLGHHSPLPHLQEDHSEALHYQLHHHHQLPLHPRQSSQQSHHLLENGLDSHREHRSSSSDLEPSSGLLSSNRNLGSFSSLSHFPSFSSAIALANNTAVQQPPSASLHPVALPSVTPQLIPVLHHAFPGNITLTAEFENTRSAFLIDETDAFDSNLSSPSGASAAAFDRKRKRPVSAEVPSSIVLAASADLFSSPLPQHRAQNPKLEPVPESFEKPPHTHSQSASLVIGSAPFIVDDRNSEDLAHRLAQNHLTVAAAANSHRPNCPYYHAATSPSSTSHISASSSSASSSSSSSTSSSPSSLLSSDASCICFTSPLPSRSSSLSLNSISMGNCGSVEKDLDPIDEHDLKTGIAPEKLKGTLKAASGHDEKTKADNNNGMKIDKSKPEENGKKADGYRADDRKADGFDEKTKSPVAHNPKMSISKRGSEARDGNVAKYLKNVPLLAKLNDGEREILGTALEERSYAANSKIISEGEEGKDFFIIKVGQCRVTRVNGETGREVELAVLKQGDYFGESALLNNSRRGATITALHDSTVVWALSSEKFHSLFGNNRLNITFAKRAAVSAESGGKNDLGSLKSAPKNAIRDKSGDVKEMIKNVVKNNILTQGLSAEQQLQIIDTMWLKEVKAHEIVIKQGDLGDYWYVVQSGKFEIFVTKDGQTSRVAIREAGSSFGELALLYNAPRAATVIASENSTLWTVDRWTFRRILTTTFDKKIKEYEAFLRGVQSFEVLLDYERSKIAEALEEVSYLPNYDIVRQGQQGDTFFILKRGEVIVTQTDSKGNKREVARYRAGDYFGERALIKKEERAATVTSISAVECLYLNRDAFNLLLGPLEDIFKTRVDNYKRISDSANNVASSAAVVAQVSSSSSSSSSMPAFESHLRTDIRLSDLAVLGTLGKGSFGHVQLVKEKTKKESRTYALKTVSKAQVVQLGQQEHIMNEKRVMAQLNHNFLIKLIATFKDRNCLYFLLEPSLGGELFSVLRAKTFFDEHTARFYAAGVVLAFEYMHERGIIYRDLKPENLLLDDKGYIKITDFGFAKQVGDNRTWTLCGTPDYLAPEVVSGQGHGKGVDWWTLGILIYEMLASYPPFYDEDPMKTYAKIMHGQIAFPMHFSKQAVDLIKKLLHQKPTKRIGVLAGGAKLIKDHPWFAGFDWDSFYSKRLPAPIVLPVRNNEDLSNFEEYPDDDMQVEDYVPDPKNPEWDKEF